MKISFNKATWYSKLLSVIFLFGIFPVIVFCIGRQYQELVQIASDSMQVQFSYDDVKEGSDKKPLSGFECDGQTTQEMAQCAYDYETRKNEELEEILYKLTHREWDPTSVVSQLEDSQKKWLLYKESSCKTLGLMYGNGTGGPLAVSMCEAGLTGERVKELQAFRNTF